MLLSIDVNPVFSQLVILSLIIIVAGFVFLLLKQPSIISYILVGVFVGPDGFGLITDETLISNLGNLGLVLLMFFIGMELELSQLLANWRIATLGTALQIAIGFTAMFVLSGFFDWGLKKTIIFSFVISVNSTAVILKILEDKKQIHSPVGGGVISILLAQDILIVPMLIFINYMGGGKMENAEIMRQVIGGVLLIGFMIFLFRKRTIKLPFSKFILRDHEIQVFVAFALCFGFSMLSSFFQLSSALGAFVAGMMISSARSTRWVHDSLHAFRVLFVAAFFVSVGMLVNIRFLLDNYFIITIMVIALFLLNNTTSFFVFRLFKNTWQQSIYAGSLLAQIGEFSFILGTTAYHFKIITDYTFQIIISVISLTLLLSPMWINMIKKVFKVDC